MDKESRPKLTKKEEKQLKDYIIKHGPDEVAAIFKDIRDTPFNNPLWDGKL